MAAGAIERGKRTDFKILFSKNLLKVLKGVGKLFQKFSDENASPIPRKRRKGNKNAILGGGTKMAAGAIERGKRTDFKILFSKTC